MAIQTGQDKLNQALHNDSCTGTWTLRVNDPCNAEKLDAIVTALGGTPTPIFTTQTIYNEVIATASTEQSLSIPGVISGYMIKSRNRGIVQLSHVSGESGVKFLTIKSGAVYTNEKEYNNLVLYFQSPTVNEVIEIVTWS
jgi:hypothetical protein